MLATGCAFRCEEEPSQHYEFISCSLFQHFNLIYCALRKSEQSVGVGACIVARLAIFYPPVHGGQMTGPASKYGDTGRPNPRSQRCHPQVQIHTMLCVQLQRRPLRALINSSAEESFLDV
ncbi:hypothetical protein L3Q82_020387 [Scortum barcoo]|uniref:Uncharacterized protein n=1 Tax=Scortum barcoo TaxID=214431 RepID=A0ACB8V7F0_9TELE|nr:hypothetical protein L3Q82_020387 [Scortum barcoo]